MGRRPSEPKKTPNGTYRCWHPSLKRYVNLGTSDYNSACELQKSFYSNDVTTKTETNDVPIIQPNPNGGGDNPTMINLDDKNDTIDLLANWAKNNEPKVETSSQSVTQPTVPISSIFTSTQSENNQSSLLVSNSKGTKPKGISPEQSAKIASGLKKIAVNTNIVVVGAAIQMFGVVPAPLDKEEIELLQMGWEMWLDELFNKAKLKPVYLVIVGNIMIAISMYAAGTKIPKEIKNQTAPGHEAPKSMHLVSPPRQTVVPTGSNE